MKDLVKWKVKGIFKADANKCYAEMLDLENITPQAVLEKAKDENSELHKCFEWDNDVAAEKYRTIQAGNVIRMLYIEPKSEAVARLAKQMINNADVVLRTDKLIAEGKLLKGNTISKIVGSSENE